MLTFDRGLVMCAVETSAQTRASQVAKIKKGADFSGFDNPLRVLAILEDCAIPPLVLPLTFKLRAMSAYGAPYELKLAQIGQEKAAPSPTVVLEQAEVGSITRFVLIVGVFVSKRIRAGRQLLASAMDQCRLQRTKPATHVSRKAMAKSKKLS